MKIIGHRHTGIIVNDFEIMLDYYLGLGFELRVRDIEQGNFINKLLGTDDIILETGKLILNNRDLEYKYRFQLEVMFIKNEIKKNEIKLFDFIKSFGVLDLAFTIDKINEVIEYIISKNGKVLSEPIKATQGFPALHMYASDPEGNVLHLAQNL